MQRLSWISNQVIGKQTRNVMYLIVAGGNKPIFKNRLP